MAPVVIPQSCSGRRGRLLLALFLAALLPSCGSRHEKPPAPAPVHARSKPAPLKASNNLLKLLGSARTAVTRALSAGQAHKARNLSQAAIARFLPSDASRLHHPDEFHMLYQTACLARDDAGRARVASCWLRAFAADERHGPQMGWAEIVELAEAPRSEGDAPARERLLDYAGCALADETGRKPPTFLQLDALLAAGRSASREPLARIASQRLSELAKGKPFPSELAPAEIALLASRMKGRGDAAGLAALGDFVARDYLAQPGLAQALTPDEWGELLGLLAEADPKLREQLVTTCAEALKGRPVLVASQGRAELNALLTRFPADACDARETLAASWLGLDDAWDALKPATRSGIMNVLNASPSEAAGSLASFEQAMASADDLPILDCGAVWSLVRRSGGRDAGEWPKRALAALRGPHAADLDALELKAVHEMLGAGGVALEARDLDGLAAGLARRRGKSWEITDASYRSLAAIFTRAGREKALDGQLFDDGGLNLPLAKVRAWQCRSRSNVNNDCLPLRGLIAHLLRQASAHKLQGDARVRVDLATAYCVSLLGREVHRGTCMPYLERALAAAKSDAMRLECLHEIAEACRPEGALDRATAAIERAREKLGAEARPQADALLRSLEPKGPSGRDVLAVKWRERFDERARLLTPGGSPRS